MRKAQDVRTREEIKRQIEPPQTRQTEQIGRILSCVGGRYECLLPEGERVVCLGGGRLRHKGVRPLPGDFALLQWGEGDGLLLTGILRRKNALLRPPMANLTSLLLVASAASPATLPLNLDKLIAIARHEGISVTLAVTKCDLGEEQAKSLAETYRLAGYPVFLTVAPEKIGVEALRGHLLSLAGGKSAEEEGVIALAGASGSGKSTLLNALFPSLSLDTGAVSRKIQRGKNTTRKVTLFPLSSLTEGACAGGYLADTPGFTLLDFVNFDFFPLRDLPDTFLEFSPYLSLCRYTDCTHTREEGCAILDAVRAGKIAKSRHDSYLSLYADLKSKKSWER